MYAGRLLRGLFLLVVVVAFGGASAAAVHAAKLYPVLEVVGDDAELGAVNDIAFDAFSLDANGETASVAITTAPAFNGSVTRAVGTRLGAAQVGVRSAPGTGAVTKYFGSLIVMDPAAYAADEGAVACAPDTHTAVWKLVVASAAGGKLTIQVAVDSTGKGYKLTMCFGAVRALSRTTAYVYLETSGMFRNPGKHGDYLFSATVTPFATDGTSNVDAAYELRGYESLPQTVNAEAKFNTTAKNLTVTGILKFNGHPRGDANVHFYGGASAASKTWVEIGVATSAKDGSYAFSKNFAQIPYKYIYAATFPLYGATCSGKSVLPGGCASSSIDGVSSVAVKVLAVQGLVIRLRTTTLTSTKHDALPKGASKGDRYTSTDKLINIGAQFGQKGGTVVGTDKAVSSFTSATTAVVSGVATLPGGTITFKGVLAIVSGGFSVPVVSGTGKFAGVGGTLTVGSGKDAINTYALTFP